MEGTTFKCNGNRPSTKTICDESNMETFESTTITATATSTTTPNTPALSTLTEMQGQVLRKRLPAGGGGGGGGGCGGGPTSIISSPASTGPEPKASAIEAIGSFCGSLVERISGTPRPSPQGTPSKRAATSTTPSKKQPSSAVMHTACDVKVAQCTSKSLHVSSTPAPDPSSSASVMVAGAPSPGAGGGGDADEISSSTCTTAMQLTVSATALADYNEMVSSKMLPLADEAAVIAADSTTMSVTACSSTTTTLRKSPDGSSVTSQETTTNITLKSLSIHSELLHWKDMPEYLQFNPYVLNGYRPLQTFKGCLFSLFYWHNESINILTHALPIIYILAIVPSLMPWERGYRFLSFCHVFGSVAPWCGSFVYHLFMNIQRGERFYYCLLKLDMVGIWVSQSFGALPLIVATTFCFNSIWKWLIIVAYCLTSLWGLYKALTASSPWQRRLCFAMPFALRCFLTSLRTMGLVGGNQVALSHVYLQDGVSILGGAIGAMRIPEKWFPGLVDYYLNSHNIMHVLVVVAVYSMHQATVKDFEWMSTTSCSAAGNSTNELIMDLMQPNVEL